MKPATVTITVADNPLAGMPGQTDVTITISSVPDAIPNDPESLTPAMTAAIAAVAHVAGQSLEWTFVHVAAGDFN